ncbi:hypothetical protein VNI00_001796 [Paramarasmius palmivorus]|uniref:Uncharacterized protein n=1 Tax=Paramarasmius palmivorus TaxID=297713 RepID=A0AAW0E4R0_9AGAR
MKPIFKDVATSGRFGGVNFGIVDLEEQQEIAKELKNDGIPKADLYQGGKRVARKEGACEKNVLEDWLVQAINNLGASRPRLHTKLSTTSISGILEENACIKGKTQAMCMGKFEDRRKRPLMLPNRRTFKDLEPNCVFQPTEDDPGILIGRANEGASYFDILLWNSPQDQPGKVYFSIDFMPDPTKEERFESAMFSVAFGEDSVDGEHYPLMIQDLYPKDEYDMLERGIFNTERFEEQDPNFADDASSAFSSVDANRTPRGRATSTVVRGHGIHSQTAAWSLSLDSDMTTRRELDAQYDMYVTLPSTNRVWIQFWGKAVLVKGDGGKHRSTLKIGSMDKPYERILDLSVVLRHGENGGQVFADI